MADPDLLANDPKPLLPRPVLGAVVAVALLVAVLVLRRSDPPASVPPPPAVSAGIPAAVLASPLPDGISQVTYSGGSHGFAIELLCSTATPGEACAQRLLVTTDAGISWQSRGTVPASDGGARLIASSPTELTWLDPVLLTEGWRSSDGGVTWARQAVTVGAVAPAPAGMVTWTFTGCAGSCRMPTPAWVDPLSLVEHSPPGAPVLPSGQRFSTVSSSGDGSVLVSGATGASAGLIATSLDGGSTWRQSSLTTDRSIVAAQVIAVRGGGYVVATAVNPAAGGSTATRLYRTDDAGLQWQRITIDEPLSVWQITGPVGTAPPDSGELVAVDQTGQLLRSSTAGTVWSPVAGSPRLDSISVSPGALWGPGSDGVQISVDDGGSWVVLTPPSR